MLIRSPSVIGHIRISQFLCWNLPSSPASLSLGDIDPRRIFGDDSLRSTKEFAVPRVQMLRDVAPVTKSYNNKRAWPKLVILDCPIKKPWFHFRTSIDVLEWNHVPNASFFLRWGDDAFGLPISLVQLWPGSVPWLGWSYKLGWPKDKTSIWPVICCLNRSWRNHLGA